MLSLPYEIYANENSQIDDQWELYFYTSDNITNPVSKFVDNISDKLKLDNKVKTVTNNLINTTVAQPLLNSAMSRANEFAGFNLYIPPSNIDSVTLPIGVSSFTFEDLNNYEHIYKSRSIDKNFMITVREDKYFTILKFFKEWADSIYHPSGYGQEGFATNANSISRYAEVKFTHQGIGVITDSAVFKLSRIKFKSIDENKSLSYGDGKPLTWTINMIVEDINVETCSKIQEKAERAFNATSATVSGISSLMSGTGFNF